MEDSRLNTAHHQPLLTIALIAMAGLVLEIGLTRLFSVLFFPPTVFAILSLAVLGTGLGAALVIWRSAWRKRAFIPLYLAVAALSVVGLSVITTIGWLQPLLFPLVVLPYLFIGMALTALFNHAPRRSPQLYLADLSGAGVGALLAVPLLNRFGALNGVLSTAVLLALAAATLRGRRLAVLPLPFLGLTVLLFAGNLIFPWLSIRMDNLPVDKPIEESLAGPNSKIVATLWDAFARTDLVDPGDGEPYRLFMDGAAGSVMPPAISDDFLRADIGFFPFATEQPQRVFLIGPGGGLDLWFALESGAAEIVGVEVNRASVQLLDAYGEYNGNISERSQVAIHVDNGRSVLRRDETHYDLIFLSQLVTLTAERNGYALVENSALTVEAFGDYLDHLTPAGQIGIKLYDEPTLTRALSTALAAFHRRGLSDQAGLQHVIALLDRKVQPPIPLLIIGKRAFARDDALALGAVARQVGFTPLFLPGVLANPPLNEVVTGRRPFSDVIAASTSDLSPPTDNRPFFYQFERYVPRSLRPPLWGAAAVFLFGTGLLVIQQRQEDNPRRLLLAPLYFSGLGLGFMLVEIAVIQQTHLFLGHPTTATTVVLATLLIFGGLGSGLAGRWVRGRESLPLAPLLAVLAMLLLWLIVWPTVEERFVDARLFGRILVVAVNLLPLGLVMGMPFPLGLRVVSTWGQEQVALAWAVNGVMSVIGSVLAVVLAIEAGFSTALLAGGVAYGIAVGAASVARTRGGNFTPKIVAGP